jgi:hypothetical protein
MLLHAGLFDRSVGLRFSVSLPRLSAFLTKCHFCSSLFVHRLAIWDQLLRLRPWGTANIVTQGGWAVSYATCSIAMTTLVGAGRHGVTAPITVPTPAISGMSCSVHREMLAETIFQVLGIWIFQWQQVEYLLICPNVFVVVAQVRTGRHCLWISRGGINRTGAAISHLLA